MDQLGPQGAFTGILDPTFIGISMKGSKMPKAATKSTAAMVIPMHTGKVCKGSVRYEADQPDAAVTNIYLMKSFAGDKPMPSKISITVEAVE